ncbi:HCO3 transporter family-domain-containing protein [Phlyctochytrium arcticum]|nr:HCO3 transporter family-domain-containing protein [Phlyctochytrium arcticum]
MDRTAQLQRPRIRPYKDIAAEVKARLPYYWSDWRDGFTSKKVFAASIFIFFTNVAPAITFGFYLDDETNSTVGVSEVLLSSALSGVIYSVFCGQPLVIVGVTGPTSIFTVTVWTVAKAINVTFLPFYAWTILWSAAMHILLAILGTCTMVTIVTRFSCEIFGCLIAIVYLLNGGREILKAFQDGSFEVGLLSLLFALMTLWSIMQLSAARHWSWGKSWIRSLISDYAVPICVTLATVLSVVLSRVDSSGLERLNVPSDKPFLTPTNGRSWIVDLGGIPVWAIFAAILPGAVLTILFYFDHNVSSLLSQRPENNLVKPAAFNWDFLILGVTMIPCGILGLPPCNGLIPQAPLHVRALAKIKLKRSPHHPDRLVEVWEGVQEQRLSNFSQGLLTLIALIPPVLKLVGEIPRAVLAGLFFAMGFASFVGNQLAQRTALFLADPTHRRAVFPLIHSVPFSACAKLTLVQLVFLGATLGITESGNAAALTFPLFIAALVPIRYFLLQRFIPGTYLAILDADDGRDFDPAEGPNTTNRDSLNHGMSHDHEMGPATGMEGIGSGSGLHPSPTSHDDMEVGIIDELDLDSSSQALNATGDNLSHRNKK